MKWFRIRAFPDVTWDRVIRADGTRAARVQLKVLDVTVKFFWAGFSSVQPPGRHHHTKRRSINLTVKKQKVWLQIQARVGVLPPAERSCLFSVPRLREPDPGAVQASAGGAGRHPARVSLHVRRPVQLAGVAQRPEGRSVQHNAHVWCHTVTELYKTPFYCRLL